MFPVGTVLENHIISDDAVDVKRSDNDLIGDHVAQGDDGPEEMEIFGTDVYWKIALRGGQRIGSWV